MGIDSLILEELRAIFNLLCERLPDEDYPPKVYGIWDGTGWNVNMNGMMLHTPYKNVAQAMALQYSTFANDKQAREIGLDGLPVPE